MHRCSALAMRGAEAVGAGVAAADDHHAFAGGADRLGLGHVLAVVSAVLLCQELHREVNAAERSP